VKRASSVSIDERAAVNAPRGSFSSPRLHVLMDVSTCASGRWRPFVADVGRAVGLEVSYAWVPGTTKQWLAAVLRTSAASAGPVLVLPRAWMHGAEHSGQVPRLRQVVIASDDSPGVSRAIRLCTLQLRGDGIHTTVVLVFNPETAPAIWEGTGHEVTAWRNERERRYGSPDRLEILEGDPGAVVREHCLTADLVLIPWHQAISVDRAPVVRAVLDEGESPPCLLLPLRWIRTGSPRQVSTRNGGRDRAMSAT